MGFSPGFKNYFAWGIGLPCKEIIYFLHHPLIRTRAMSRLWISVPGGLQRSSKLIVGCLNAVCSLFRLSLPHCRKLYPPSYVQVSSHTIVKISHKSEVTIVWTWVIIIVHPIWMVKVFYFDLMRKGEGKRRFKLMSHKWLLMIGNLPCTRF